MSAIVLDAFRAALKAAPEARYGMRLYMHGLDEDGFRDAPGRLVVDGDLAWKEEKLTPDSRIFRYPKDSTAFVDGDRSDTEIYGAGVS